MQALKAGDFAAAQRILSPLVAHFPSAENTNYLAIAEAGAGNVVQAIAHFQESIRLGNNSAAVHTNLGMVYLQSGRHDNAVLEFRAAIAIDPKSVPSLYLLGVALLDAGLPREALPHLRKAHKLAPDNGEIQVSLVRAQFQLGNNAAALELADRALGGDSKNPSMIVALASLCVLHGQVQRARYMLEVANARMPHDFNIELSLARVCLQAGEPKEALSALEDLPSEAAKPGEIMLLKGEARTLTGDFLLADADLAAALEADPRNPRYLIAHAWLKQREGQHKEALGILSEVHELEPQMPVVSLQMAVAYYLLRLQSQARQACEDAIRLDPHYGLAYCLLGALELREKNFAGAQAAFQQAINWKPNVAQFHTLSGIALYKEGKLTESHKELDRALMLNPQSAQAHFYRGQVFARQGNTEKAIVDLETAVALLPNYRSAYAELAQLYEKNGQPAKAMAAAAREKSEQQGEESYNELMLQQLEESGDEIGVLGLPAPKSP
jgi:tetratricopeptide (TPR) repeat protein